ncbi:MAG: MBL fold metallo-hydrolase [Lachnospiraceae bacterium]|nr:MBL fold metallo-hydrolase [Lachnospiraceae bacterium]
MSAYIKFHRGSHIIGGTCTELCSGNGRVLIDFGSNLPGMDEECPISDKKLIEEVFGGASDYDAVLFTHYHGDHIGLYKDIPRGQEMYIGETAKEILQIVTEYTDRNSDIRGNEIIKGMRTYRPGHPLVIGQCKDMKITPFSVDHSALDAYMFLIEMAGKRILYTGDFRDHGIASEEDQFWNLIESDRHNLSDIDVLVTEGTMLSREKEISENIVRTEAELGKEAAKRFRANRYNFVMVSSTNLDSIMEIYHNTPDDVPFVCDLYQARIISRAMQKMKNKSEKYRPKKMNNGKTRPIHLLLEHSDEKVGELIKENNEKKLYLGFQSAQATKGYDTLKNGFVMLVRPNHYPEKGRSPFEKALDHFSALSENEVCIMYSLWAGYLKGDRKDKTIVDFIGSHRMQPLHVSGHAYPETILKLIGKTGPKVIIPMHTAMADQMHKMSIFSEYGARIHPMRDVENIFDLEKMEVRQAQN